MSDTTRRFRKNMSNFFFHPLKADGPIHFKYNRETGYVPILKLMTSAAGGSNNYFLSESPANHRRSTKYSVEESMETLHTIFRFNHSSRRMMDIPLEARQPKTLSIFFYTILGVTENYYNAVRELRANSRYMKATPKSIMTNSIDIFALSVIKTEDISSIKVSNHYIDYDPTKIKILLSQEKFKTPAYMNNNYNRTVRSHLVRVINQLDIETEVVSDAELKTYYKNPFSFESTSITDIMQVDREIKESVMSGITENLVRV